MPYKYEVGDRILIRKYGGKIGLTKKFLPDHEGPFKITQVLSQQNYMYGDNNGNYAKVYYSRMLPFYDKARSNEPEKESEVALFRKVGRPKKAGNATPSAM